MATTITAEAARFSIGGVIGRVASVLGRHFLLFFGLGLIAGIPGQVFNYAMLPSANANGSLTAFGGGHGGLIAGSFLLWIVMTTLLQASITYGTVMDLSEQPTSFGRALATAVRAFFPLLGLSLIYVFSVMFATILLIVPGVMLAIAWISAIPVRVVERTSVFGAFGRSRTLTKGHRWAILGLWVIYFVGATILQMVVTYALVRPLGVMGYVLVALLVGWLVQAITTVIATTGSACVYFDLRSEKEGIGPQQLAAVFD